MPTDDHKGTNEETREDTTLSVEDLTGNGVEDQTAARVKGGTIAATGSAAPGSATPGRANFDVFTDNKG